jgi:hypothetical protein
LDVEELLLIVGDLIEQSRREGAGDDGYEFPTEHGAAAPVVDYLTSQIAWKRDDPISIEVSPSPEIIASIGDIRTAAGREALIRRLLTSYQRRRRS